MDRNARVAVGFLTGLGIGLGLGLLFSPLSGGETREWLAEKGSEGVDCIRDFGRNAMDRFQESEVVAQSREAVAQGKDKVSRAAKAGKRAARAGKEPFEAGKESLRHSGIVS